MSSVICFVRREKLSFSLWKNGCHFKQLQFAVAKMCGDSLAFGRLVWCFLKKTLSSATVESGRKILTECANATISANKIHFSTQEFNFVVYTQQKASVFCGTSSLTITGVMYDDCVRYKLANCLSTAFPN